MINKQYLNITPVLSSGDEEAYYTIYVKYQSELMQNAKDCWDIQTKDEVHEDHLKYRMYNKKDCLIMYQGEHIGLINYQDIKFENPNMFYIDQIYIMPEYRRQGIATECIKLITEGISPNTSIWLYVFKKNKLGNNFWKKAFNKLHWKKSYDSRCVTGIDDDPEELAKFNKYTLKSTSK